MFEKFWKAYPHHPTRSKKAMARAIWEGVLEGRECSVRDNEGNTMRLSLKATEDEIVMGAKAYAMVLENREYAAGAQVWLNQGRWMDFDNVEELAERYDRIQERVESMGKTGKLRVV